MKTILAIALAIVTTASAEKIVIALKSGGSMTGTLVAKSATEIKVETAYGIIALPSNAVTPESWDAAHRAAISKPSGKYLVPNPSRQTPQPSKRIEKQDAPIPVAVIEKSYAANPIAANRKFIDKAIAVRGIINKIGPPEFGRGAFVQIGNNVIKYYPFGSEKSITHLQVGQTTTLTGTCQGISDDGLIVIRD